MIRMEVYFNECVCVHQWNDTSITSSWVQKGQDIDDEAPNNYSEWSVSMSNDGNTVAIGAS